MREHLVRNRRVFQGHSHHLRAGHFSTLTDGIGHFSGLAHAHPNPAMLVAHDNQRAEMKAASAFDHFGRTVDEHDFLRQLLAGFDVESGLGFGTAPPSAIWPASASLVSALYFGWFSHNILLR